MVPGTDTTGDAMAKGKSREKSENVVIIGSGPAGLTAAIYTARADLNPVVVAGMRPGGQLVDTTTVEIFPGFPDGIDGPELMMNMRKQAERFNAKFIDEDVVSVDFRKRPFTIRTETAELKAETVIIATGASAKWLGLPNEKRLAGKGVSGCATCDGFFFKGKEVAVIGGGDTALEDAMFLTRYAAKVTVVHRRDKLRASMIMQDRAFANKKISFIWDSVVEDILGADKVTGVRLKNLKTGKSSEFKCDGVFVAVGHAPATGFLKGQIELEETGYIRKYNGTKTSVEGVFSAGDVADKAYRQAVSAAGDGCRAGIDAERYLQEKKK
ncbi:Sulfide dehydrogenase subunit alpha [uncultured archaeon]|nr:Sulfide dehydrogenase subunit alpha [uncultured archaeon]